MDVIDLVFNYFYVPYSIMQSVKHNVMQVRILEDIEKKCYLVKFRRLCGDSLCFGRNFQKLVKECGSVLTRTVKVGHEH